MCLVPPATEGDCQLGAQHCFKRNHHVPTQLCCVLNCCPRRAVWRRLCGSASSVTVADLLLVCLWAAINLSWFTAALAYYQHKAVLKAAANGLGSATGQQLLKAAARSFGATLAPNLGLLMYPVSRGSAVLQVLGVSYPAGIRCVAQQCSAANQQLGDCSLCLCSVCSCLLLLLQCVALM